MTQLVVVCGSLSDEWRLYKAARQSRRDGILTYIPRADPSITEEEHAAEHRQWIDLASEVLAVTKPDGSFGEATRSEVAYAQAQGKLVYQWPVRAEHLEIGDKHRQYGCVNQINNKDDNMIGIGWEHRGFEWLARATWFAVITVPRDEPDKKVAL